MMVTCNVRRVLLNIVRVNFNSAGSYYLCMMKMRNDDVKKITEIKQYLFDPPASFKLYDYALNYLQEAITVLTAYPKQSDTMVYLQDLLAQLQNKTIPQGELRNTLKEAGKKMSRVTSN